MIRVFYLLFLPWLCTFCVYGKLEPFNFFSSVNDNAERCHRCDPMSKTESLKLLQPDPFLGIKMLYGYLHTGRESGKMFYWIVPQNQKTGEISNDLSKPWAVWLSGGPGCGSELALFTENGPMNILQDGRTELNPHSWHLLADMVYIDQPLGTGFSDIDGSPLNYVTNEKAVALDMKYFLEKLLRKYPAFKNRPFYLTGESFAGHYIPSIGHHLAEFPAEALKFVGVAIGNGWVDPALQYPSYATFGVENKLIPRIGYKLAAAGLEMCVQLIKQGKYMQASLVCNSISNGILGKRNPYDIRLICDIPPTCYNDTALNVFLNRPDVQGLIGVNKKWNEIDKTVYLALMRDMDTETRTKVESILAKGIKVLIYHGDQDYICNWRGGESWVHRLNWFGSEKFTIQAYKPWLVENRPAGEFKHVQNLAFLRVYDAGHMVPMDQPVVALQMMRDFVYSSLLGNGTVESKPLTDNENYIII